jgi:hypothetical protein
VASFVPSVQDFDRLDPQFVIPQESWDQIPEYSDYGFAVFQLKSLAGKPHPIAFEFETRIPDRIFFPTVHIHDGEVHERESFDHTLYVQHPEFDRVAGPYAGPTRRDSQTGHVRSKWPAQQFCAIGKSEGIVDPELLVHRIEMRGHLPNRDVIQPVSFASAAVRPAPSRSLHLLTWPVFAALLAASGLLWLFQRRTLLSSRTRSTTPRTSADTSDTAVYGDRSGRPDAPE